jgi:CspA family cold shock protein
MRPSDHFTGGKQGNRRRHGMPVGTVKWFNTTKGYGFIEPEDGGKDVFVHISAVEQSGMTGLADNQKVSFELIEGRDGRQMAGDLKAL